MSTVYVNIDIQFTIEKIEKIEYMKINKLIKLHLIRLKKLHKVCTKVVQYNNEIRFY